MDEFPRLLKSAASGATAAGITLFFFHQGFPVDDYPLDGCSRIGMLAQGV
jgi:hypothetical protein